MSDERDQTDATQNDAPEDDAAASTPGQTDAADTDATDEQAPAPVDPVAARAARLVEIDRELVAADRQLQAVQNSIQLLQRERDRLTRMGLGPAQTQADALKQVVESDQRQRMQRAEVAAAVTGLLGGKMPSVLTPAEMKARATKKNIVLKPIAPPQQ